MNGGEGALQPAIVHRRRRVARVLALLGGALAIAAAAAAVAGWTPWRAKPRPMSPCERAVRSGELRSGVELCLKRHEQTRDPHDLMWAAEAYLSLGEYARAGALARQLIGGQRQADGHRILSHVVLHQTGGDPREALSYALMASAVYSSAGDERGLMSALLAHSQAAWRAGDFAGALDAADQALQLAERLRDRRNEVLAHLLRADALQRIGDGSGARNALERATERATTPCDRTWAHFRMGVHEMNRGYDAVARLELGNAEMANRECRHPSVTTSLSLAMAWLARSKDPAGALRRLDEVEQINGEDLETLLLRGYLAADRGDLAAAEDYLVRAEAAAARDADWAWDVASGRAELAELRGGPFDDLLAEYHYRRAIEMVGELRRRSPTEAADLVSSHRAPYDGLIALYARAGRWRDALAVILELDASDMLRATAARLSARGHTPLDLEPPPARPREAARTPATVDEVLAAWRDRELVIAIAPPRREIGPGRERAYRLQVTGGQLTGEEIGDANAARQWAVDLFTRPDDEAAARALGRLLVPPGPSSETLDVLAIGVLGQAPLAALRDEDGAPIIARRPLARVLTLRPRSPRPASAEPPIVLADPEGNLPAAALEGSFVTSTLGASARLFGAKAPSPATRARLWEARRAELLHVAAHVGERGRWRALMLSDGAVSPDEMVRAGLAPELAVIASCGSLAARDEEGWGSIAAALLEAGTTTVIAADRTIPDAASLTLMRRFYEQPDWRTAPARALARVQQEATRDPAIPPGVWAAFTVLRQPPG